MRLNRLLFCRTSQETLIFQCFVTPQAVMVGSVSQTYITQARSWMRILLFFFFCAASCKNMPLNTNSGVIHLGTSLVPRDVCLWCDFEFLLLWRERAASIQKLQRGVVFRTSHSLFFSWVRTKKMPACLRDTWHLWMPVSHVASRRARGWSQHAWGGLLTVTNWLCNSGMGLTLLSLSLWSVKVFDVRNGWAHVGNA